MAAKTFEDLEIWQKAHAVVLEVYATSRAFPREEVFGLRAQVRRSAASAPANIAEGFRRPSKADKARFYTVALGSLDETRYHLRLAHDLGYADTIRLRDRVDEVTRMLDAYVKAVAASDRAGRVGRGLGLAGLVSLPFWFLTSGF